jgi:hypothetical protein
MEQQVQFQRIVRNTKTSYLPSTYEFRVDRKYHWLQKFALWILRKLRCNACHLEESVRYDVVDTQNLMKNLIEQQQEIVNFYHRYSGHVLLVRESSTIYAVLISIILCQLICSTYGKNQIAMIIGFRRSTPEVP